LLKYSEVKQEDAFLFRTHDKTSFKELKKALEKAVAEFKEMVEFQQTSCIMHVACKTIDDAFSLVKSAKEAGWKRSGIMGGERNMVELHSTESMSFPIANNGKIIVDDEFIKMAVEIANNKLERVWKKISRLVELI
jgi:tRNA wybutosine-synthesizing protein 3